MKLFSRKALVAGAAAVALSFAGTSAAVAETTTEVTTTEAPAPGSTDPNKGDEPTEVGSNKGDNDLNNGLSSTKTGDKKDPADPDAPKEDGSSDAKEISAWISVFTAVIGALGALFSFASKYLGFKL